ncbi:MAG: hypothetical protein KDB35_16925 [Acidimicrobiales bacterium]|nr:hypothetical protein [Acidimicrobiales bacterium]
MPTPLDTRSPETRPSAAGTTPGASDVLSPPALERRGLWWLLWSFLLCPCHLPLSLGVLTALFAGTSLGAAFRDHTWMAGTLLTVTWLAGTAYGFHLIRQAKRAAGACPTRSPSADR